MSGWQVVTAQPTLSAVNGNVICLLLGLYGWEYIMSFSIEYQVIRGRLSFRWPLIPYIAGRMSLFVYNILLAVGTSPFSKGILCLPSIFLTSISGNIALGCSSIIFMIRTWFIWKDSCLVHALLFLLTLGLISMLVFGITHVKPIETNGICDVYMEHPQVNAIVIIYTTCYDLLVFILSVVGLSRQRSESPLKKRLRTQGVLYFAIGWISYIPPMVFALLGQTALMIIFCNCAITASTIVSSRAMRSLLYLDIDTSDGQTQGNDVTLTTHIQLPRDHDGTPDGRPASDKTEPC